MAINVHSPSVAITASTTSANAALPNSSGGYLYVCNGTNGIAYVNAGIDNTVTATNTNPGVAPGEAQFFIRDVNNDKYVAILLSTGATTGVVSVTPTGNPTE